MTLLRWALHHFGLHWWREWDSTYHAVTYRRCRVCGLLETVEKRWLF